MPRDTNVLWCRTVCFRPTRSLTLHTYLTSQPILCFMFSPPPSLFTHCPLSDGRARAGQKRAHDLDPSSRWFCSLLDRVFIASPPRLHPFESHSCPLPPLWHVSTLKPFHPSPWLSSSFPFQLLFSPTGSPVSLPSSSASPSSFSPSLPRGRSPAPFSSCRW